MVDESQMILDRVRSAHGQNLVLAVVGWQDKNHTPHTRSLPEDKFIFFRDAPLVLPHKIGYVIMTDFISRDQISRVRNQKPNFSRPLTPGRVKKILELVAPPAVSPSPPSQGIPVPETSTSTDTPTQGDRKGPLVVADTTLPGPRHAIQHDSRPGVAESVSQPDSNDSAAIAFAKEFVFESDKSKDKSLSKYQAAVILEKYFGERRKNPSQHKNLLEPVVKEGGTKAGSYKATDKLLELAMIDPDEEPKDPIARARWLVARGEKLLAKRDALEAEKAAFLAKHGDEMGEINNQLVRCERARKMLADLEKL